MTHAIQVHSGEPPRTLERRPAGLLRPIAPAADVIVAQNEARDLIAKALVDGRDFGRIPGTGDKPTLLKPGAERLTLAFGLCAQFKILEHERDHDRVNVYRKGDKELQSLGLYRVVMECSLMHRESGEIVGSAIASCSTLEAKYISRPRDSENTVIKMATKRSHVGATLNALGLSEQFTQDVEDLAGAGAEQQQSAAAASSSSSTPAADPVDSSCPKCGGAMWDNRRERDGSPKRNPKAPDFKCKDKSCEGVIWPPKPGEAPAATNGGSAASGTGNGSTTDAPIGSLTWAQQLPLMGKPTSWTHDGISYGRKPIGIVPTPALKQAKHFIADLLEKNPGDERASSLREQVQAIALVVDERAKLDPKQEELAIPVGAPVATVPAPSQDEQLAAAGAAARAEQTDDDLPF